MNSLVFYNTGIEDNQQIVQWLYDELLHHRDITIGFLDHKFKYAKDVMTGFKNMVKDNGLTEMFKWREFYSTSLMNYSRLCISSSASACNSFRGHNISTLVFNNFNLMKKIDIEEIFKCYIPAMTYIRKHAKLVFVLNTKEPISKDHLQLLDSVSKN